jgi:hypothetical protein
MSIRKDTKKGGKKRQSRLVIELRKRPKHVMQAIQRLVLKLAKADVASGFSTQERGSGGV